MQNELNIDPFLSASVSATSLLNQEGIVIWLLGLSGAGKSTIATLIEQKLRANGYLSVLLDGDNLRSGINRDLSFNPADRYENIRRVAEIAKILVSNNIIAICSFITPLREHRELAKKILNHRYFEVFVDCPLDVCEQRDVKGLYKKARNESISNFTGISSEFERADDANLVLPTSIQIPEQSAELLFNTVLPRIRGNNI